MFCQSLLSGGCGGSVVFDRHQVPCGGLHCHATNLMPCCAVLCCVQRLLTFFPPSPLLPLPSIPPLPHPPSFAPRPLKFNITNNSSQLPVSAEPRQGDVYRVEQEDLSGPWEVTNVLQPTVYENDKGESVGM